MPRFFTYLNLFVMAMLILVLADNLLLLFVGWEGVGLCSYLLIGFWWKDDENATAGKKAMLANRVGDACFLIGLFLLIQFAGTLNFRGIEQQLGSLGGATLGAGPCRRSCACCFLAGATGKSAQIPLYVWLPDAMAGPTPVSALIHAATMVTAGVYLTARLHGLYDLAPQALTAVAVVGAVTALFAATIAVAQNDIKKVLAYSTVSQLGYMFLGVGVGLPGRGGVPPGDPRLLQGPALPVRRQRHPRHGRRAGHAEDGRVAREASRSPSPPCRGHARHRGRAAAVGLLEQGRDHLGCLRRPACPSRSSASSGTSPPASPPSTWAVCSA